MKEPTIAFELLTLFANGGTFEGIVADLPMFKQQIESAHDWMKTSGRCSATDIKERATRLRELILRKQEAINRYNFDLAAQLRAEECALYESFGFKRGAGETWHTHVHLSIEKQTQQLSTLLHDANAA